VPYILKNDFMLEGWPNKPYCLTRDKHIRKTLTGNELLFLMNCDGVNEPASDQAPLVELFENMGVIEALDAPLDEPQANDLNMHSYLKRETLELSITGRCNYRCRHCYAAVDEHNTLHQLSLEDCRKIFTESLECGITKLWLVGGEPLFHPQYKEIVHMAVELGMTFTRIFTNAALLTQDILDDLKSLHQRPLFCVSFDGIGTHDWMRGHEGAEKLALDAITMLKENNFRVSGYVNVNGVTAPRFIETCRMLSLDYHVDEICALITSPTPRWLMLKGDGDDLSMEEYFKLMIETVRISRIEHWPVEFTALDFPHVHCAPHHPSISYLKNPPKPQPKMKVLGVCSNANCILYVSADGRALPCSAYDGEMASLGILCDDAGNVLKGSVKEALTNSEYAKQYSMTLEDMWERDTECKDCRWAGLCRGGCPLFVLGRRYWDCGSPNCAFFKGGLVHDYVKMIEETDDIFAADLANNYGRQSIELSRS